MGINQLPIVSLSKKIKYIFITIVVAVACVIIGVFVRSRIHLNHIIPPSAPQQTSATLSIQNFRHTATQDGREKWSIEASSASLYSKENFAELTDISAIFFLNDEKTILLSADKGILHIDTNNMNVSGNIIIKFSNHMLETENLNYIHNSHIINATTPVTITGETMTLKANTMNYLLDKDVIKCSGDVTGTIMEAVER
jgi:LPS export ABC transporter protein LptC